MHINVQGDPSPLLPQILRMPKPKKRGKNTKSKANSTGEDGEPVLLKGEDHEYAVAKTLLGDGRVSAECADGRLRVCRIRGKMRKRVWIVAGDLLLLSLRDFQDDKADVIHKYSQKHARIIHGSGIVIGKNADDDADQDGFFFKEPESIDLDTL